MKKRQSKPKLPRDLAAISAHFRKAGAFSDKRRELERQAWKEGVQEEVDNVMRKKTKKSLEDIYENISGSFDTYQDLSEELEPDNIIVYDEIHHHMERTLRYLEELLKIDEA